MSSVNVHARDSRWVHPVDADSSTQGSRASEIVVTVSIDTEEDNWIPARTGITVENIRELPRMHSWLRQLGIRPTYFTSYQVVQRPWARDIIRGLHESGEAEIGAHLHPWNTPPLDEQQSWRNTMLCNLPAALQDQKLAILTEQLIDVIGVAPTAFRAGRFGLGADTTSALARRGYRVDSSVTPHLDWRSYEGPDYRGAPGNAYLLGVGRDPREADPDGPVVEVPVSSGYNRIPYSWWGRVYHVLRRPPFRTFHLSGLAHRCGLLRQIMLSPETASAADMLDLSTSLIDEGATHLMLLFHSPTLVPGLSPFGRNRAEVDGLYRSIAEYTEAVQRALPVRFVTATEAADLVAPVGEHVTG